MRPPASRSNRLRVIAQDPGVLKRDREILTAQLALPPEYLDDGPWGYRVHVVDYETASDTLYRPVQYETDANGAVIDEFENESSEELLANPRFHAQNVYALVMNTLVRFEKALGRRVSWGFGGHQLKVVPHAFADANAFYSRSDEALLFGYFAAPDGSTVHTCLSHDVIVHETTHALLDGLRARFIDPSSPDQAAFHEGFADVVALLSVFALPGVVEELLARRAEREGRPNNLIPKASIKPAELKTSALLGLAEQMGPSLTSVRGDALRRSVDLPVSPAHEKTDEFQVPHRRGELLVAAIMNAFVDAWSERLKTLSTVSDGNLDLQRVAEEGRDAADYLLTMCIRALDYTPPIHLEFGDFLSAIITADLEVRPDEARYHFRDNLRRSFRGFGFDAPQGSYVPTIDERPNDGNEKQPAVSTTAVHPPEDGAWAPCSSLALVYDRTHADPLTRDGDEVFRFIWENREHLKLIDGAYTEVLSVRPSLRVGPDGFALRETVAEFYQVLRLRPRELSARWAKLSLPETLLAGDVIPLYGGGTLIFDEYGRLKYYIHNSLGNIQRQQKRLNHLFAEGVLPERGDGEEPYERRGDFSRMHRLRAFDVGDPQEEW